MARSRQRRKPSFFWQALLILLPVAILAAVGLLSLRQDKIIAQHEAADRAQSIANDLLPRVWSAVTNVGNPEAFERHAFQINATGELLFPPPFSATPAPQPLNPDELTAEQASLWQNAVQAEASDTDTGPAIQALRAFLAAKPPDRFAALVTYNLGVLLAKEDQPQAAADTFLSLLDNYPSKTAESGLPLARLAEFELLELSIIMTNPRPPKVLISPDEFCRRVIFDPSPLTSSFLFWVSAHAQALGLKDSNDYWNSVWREHEESRQLCRSARLNLTSDQSTSYASQSGTTPQIFWFNNAGENCLAIRFDGVPAAKGSTENAFSIRDQQIRTSSQAVSRIKGEMDLQPESRKNWLTSPNLSHNEPAGLQASPSGKSFYGGGTAERNGMSPPDFSGPATILQTRATNPWFLCRTESEVGQASFSLTDFGGRLPDYFGIGIEIAGKQLREPAPDPRRKNGFLEGGPGSRKKCTLRGQPQISWPPPSYPRQEFLN